MRIRIVVPILIGGLAGSVTAQLTPSSFTRTGTYSSQTLGVQQGAGGIEFDASGKTLYINDRRTGKLIALKVVRNTSGRITGFSTPTTVLTSKSAGTLDGGMALSSIGTMFLTNYQPADLEQYSPASKAHTVTKLTTIGIIGNTGAAEFLPTAGSKERLLLSDYDNGGIYVVPLTLQANLTYAFGKASLYLRTPKGIDGFEFVPSGPFGKGRGLVVVNYDKSMVDLVAIDATTGKPFTNAAGDAMFVPLITGLSEPMDIEFDPVTNDMFITDYSSGTATMLQYSGEIRGGLDGGFDLFGPGCPQKNGQVPTLDTRGVRVRGGFPVTIRLTGAPASQSVSFLLFGLGNSGNLGGFLFGGTSCRVYVNHVLMVPLATNAAGVGTLAATVPAALRGMTLFTQAWALSPGANALNLTVSDAVVSFVGR